MKNKLPFLFNWNYLVPCILSFVLQLLSATSDAEVQSIVSNEASLDILQELGYTGIPQRKTLQTAKGLKQ
jgi:hypothetical protein